MDALAHAPMDNQVCACTYIQIYVHTYIHTYTHTYTHGGRWRPQGRRPCECNGEDVVLYVYSYTDMDMKCFRFSQAPPFAKCPDNVFDAHLHTITYHAYVQTHIHTYMHARTRHARMPARMPIIMTMMMTKGPEGSPFRAGSLAFPLAELPASTCAHICLYISSFVRHPAETLPTDPRGCQAR